MTLTDEAYTRLLLGLAAGELPPRGTPWRDVLERARAHGELELVLPAVPRTAVHDLFDTSDFRRGVPTWPGLLPVLRALRAAHDTLPLDIAEKFYAPYVTPEVRAVLAVDVAWLLAHSGQGRLPRDRGLLALALPALTPGGAEQLVTAMLAEGTVVYQKGRSAPAFRHGGVAAPASQGGKAEASF